MYGSEDKSVDAFPLPFSVSFDNLPIAFAGTQKYFVISFILVSLYTFITIFATQAALPFPLHYIL